MLINNSTPGTNHFQEIGRLISESTEVYIASPFLMREFESFFSEFDCTGLQRIQLLTTLKQNSSEQINKIFSLTALSETISHLGDDKELVIKIDNRLHAKIYLFRNLDRFTGVVITSANFTVSGLSRNNELGMYSEDQGLLQTIYEQYFNNDTQITLNEEFIEEGVRTVRGYLEGNQPAEQNIEVDLNLLQDLNQEEQVQDVNIWLKPVGHMEHRVPDNHINLEEERIDFSVRPVSVNVDDIVILFAVGRREIMGIYRVTSDYVAANAQDIAEQPWRGRWNWSVQGESLNVNFGVNWVNRNLIIDQLLEQYLENDPDALITAVGGRTFGAFQRGKDKLRLNNDFGNYVIGLL